MIIVTYAALCIAFVLGLFFGLLIAFIKAFLDDTCERCGNEANEPSPELRAELLAGGGSLDIPRGRK